MPARQGARRGAAAAAPPVRDPRPGVEPARTAAGLRLRAALRPGDRGLPRGGSAASRDATRARGALHPRRATEGRSMNMEATPLIEVRRLKKYFGASTRPVRAVDDVSFAIR